MKNLFKILFLPAILISMQSVAAYETQWNDPKFPTDQTGETKGEQSSGNSLFKMDGEIWSGYDFYRPVDSVGTPPTAGGDNTGFHVGRAYVNAAGDVKDGAFKGWGYRVTMDVARTKDEISSAATKNDYNVYLKYAYINIPLANGGKTTLRLGQQQVPTVDAGAGISLQSLWGYRFLDNQGKQSWEEMGLSDSADTGVGLIHKSDYFGVHLLLANGEGYHRSNAEGLSSIDPWATGANQSAQLSTLNQGQTASNGLDVYGMLSLIPTGANKDIQWSINLPFRQQNAMGIQNTEVEALGISDPTPLSTPPTFNYYKGDKRAKRDQTYGVETDLAVKKQGFGFTVGAGTAIKRDLYGTSYRIDNALLNSGLTLANAGSYIKDDTDHKGVANYVFARANFKQVGIFGRYTEGTGNGTSLNGQLGTASNKPWLNRLVETDGADGTFGNLSYTSAMGLVNDKAKFKTILYGVSYQPHERFIIALGTRIKTGTTTSGRDQRVNQLQRIATTTGATPQTLDQQIFANAAVKNSLGYAANDTVDPNDWIGVKNVVREVFVRASYTF